MYNPLLISLGIAPKVSSATGMHLIRYSQLAASVGYLVFGVLDMQFGILLGVLTAFGAILGMVFVNKLMKKFDR